jgi:exonuclease III
MDDHLFVSRSMMNSVVSCDVLVDDDAPGDHFPVVLELEPVSCEAESGG